MLKAVAESVSRCRGRLSVLLWLPVLLLLSVRSGGAEIKWDRDTLEQSLQLELQYLQQLAATEELIEAVRQQNAEPQTLAQLRLLDQTWQASAASDPLKQTLLAHPQSQRFAALHKTESHFNEWLLVDAKGGLVAAFPITSDYWQGDEDKWKKILEDGFDRYVGAKTYDHSSGVNAVQLSVAVKDGDMVIGVLVAGVRLSHVMMRQIRR